MKIAKLSAAAMVVALMGGQAMAAGLPADVAQAFRDRLDGALIDYSSARFRDVHTQSDMPPGYFVCGYVNSKNRMGGYTGWQPFFMSNAKDQVGLPPGAIGLQMAGELLTEDQIVSRCTRPDRPMAAEDLSSQLAPPVRR